MNLRCSYCQTPFTIGRAELLAALQHMSAESLHHYDAHCPRCRKANSVARQRMEMFFPNWQQAAQEQAALPAAPAPVPAPVVEAAAPEPVKIEAEAKPAAPKKVAKKPSKPATKKPAAKKPAAPKKK